MTRHGRLGDLLVALRSRAGLGQEELARAAGISVRSLCDLERGRTRGPQRRTVRALAAALRLDDEDAAALETCAADGRHRRPAPGPAPARTLSLPRPIPDFTARDEALDRLVALASQPERAPRVHLVTGRPGLGKTTFATHAARRLAPYFPDGQYALDLHGTGETPLAPAEALERLLLALGVPHETVPDGLAARSALLRERCAARRALIVLDDCAGEEQLRPLLPGAGATWVLVTSRQALSGVAGAPHRVDLPLLRREEAVDLLGRIAGRQRVGAEAQAARDIAELCGLLPLAVRVVGQRLAARPAERLAKVRTLLECERRRLDTLQTGDLGVRPAFALSYRALDPAAALVLRRAGLADGPGFGAATAAALAGTGEAAARRHLDHLVEAGLLHPEPGTGRYAFHDLLRLFAAERAAREDGEEACAAAVARCDRSLLAKVTVFGLRFDPDFQDPAGEDAERARTEAQRWLGAERYAWMPALGRAARDGRHREVVETARALHWFSDLVPHWPQWTELFRTSSYCARELGDRSAEAAHLNFLSWAHTVCEQDPTAGLRCADTALRIAREAGDRLETGWALGYGAAALRRLGRVDDAVVRFREAVRVLRPDRSVAARRALLALLNTLGHCLRVSGRVGAAVAVRRQGLDILASLDPRALPPHSVTEGFYLREMGNDHALLGRHQEAVRHLRAAVRLLDEGRAPVRAAEARLDLGLLLTGEGRRHDALPVLREAARELGAACHPLYGRAKEALEEAERPPGP
ncbi:ATP-binding protein [Streptomyces termitum]|uniref:HTH cro/C1-type domain-containing protein n=1 Tax=Streptomyces termitum TaxID=67368 RepID=A0A918T419_9ACTN|nr:XRE family transcriptional regulator [Streptomyces termitum]GHA88231.1 hypothetical protein GCM10010305_34810 [Streptomyces termitum]